ncbi:MAG: hypothetical protein FGM46_04950 [Ferruginibacter sp.]|nr:hypothetical protein [Ferruginibacter sp.]
MIGTFKSNIPYNYFLLFIYGFLLYLPMFIRPVVPIPDGSDGVLYVALIKMLSFANHSYSFIYSLIAFALLFIQAMMLNKLANHQRMHTKSSYLTGMSYMLLTSTFMSWYGLHASLISASILIWIVSKLCNLQNNSNAKPNLFNIGLLMGFSTFFYFPSIAFFMMVLVGITILRPFKIAEWIIVFLGLITPYYFLFSFSFIFGKSLIDLTPMFSIGIPVVLISRNEYIALSLMVIAVILGIYWVQQNMRRLLIQSRKTWTILYVFLLIALLVPFLSKTTGFYNWRIAAIPFSAFSASFFLFPPVKWVSHLIHWSIVCITAYMGYQYILH